MVRRHNHNYNFHMTSLILVNTVLPTVRHGRKKWSAKIIIISFISFCARSCGSCQSLALDRGGEEEFDHKEDAITLCADDFTECNEWAMEGECSINPICKYSVGCFLSSVESASALHWFIILYRFCLITHHYFVLVLTYIMFFVVFSNPAVMHARCKYSCWKCVDAHSDRNLGVSKDIM